MTSEKDFEKETESRLSRIETKVDMLSETVHKTNAVNSVAIKALEYAKSAHHRIDEHKVEAKENFEAHKRAVQEELDEYKASIRWTIGIAVTIASLLVGLVEHFV